MLWSILSKTDFMFSPLAYANTLIYYTDIALELEAYNIVIGVLDLIAFGGTKRNH